MKKVVFSVMAITVLAKVLGFARELILSFFFGATGISDAYLISQTIPGIIFQFVGTGLATCFIPIYLNISHQEDEEKANYFTNTILTIVFVFSTIVILVVLGNTPFIVKIFASGFEGETLRNAILFTRISIMSLYFSSMIYVMNSYLQMKNKFGLVAFSAIPNSIVIMFSIIIGAKSDIIWLPIGSIIAVLIQAMVLLGVAQKENFQLRLNVNLKNPKVLEMGKLMIPVTIGVSINELNLLIDRTVASRLAVGGISALTYAESLVMFIQGIFVQTVVTVYYPSLTQKAERGDIKGTKDALKDAMKGMFFLLIPVTMGCLMLSEDLVRLLYERGNFNNDAVIMTSTALLLYTIGIIGYGFREIFSRFFYAFHDTKTPMINAAVGVTLNIIMNLTLSPILGIGGLALATSVSATITAILLFIQLRIRYGKLFTLNDLKGYIKVIISTVIMGVVVYVVKNMMLDINVYVRFAGIICCGVLSYMICALILKVDIIVDIIHDMKRRKG